jgi:hypothetical protein
MNPERGDKTAVFNFPAAERVVPFKEIDPPIDSDPPEFIVTPTVFAAKKELSPNTNVPPITGITVFTVA